VVEGRDEGSEREKAERKETNLGVLCELGDELVEDGGVNVNSLDSTAAVVREVIGGKRVSSV